MAATTPSTPTPAGAAEAAAAAPGGRERFLAACACRPLKRPPVWLMRQAGRALPEYRLLKEKYSFLDLVRTPALASQVTLQPIQRFGFDAAIIFSDILVIAEAMGQPYAFREGGGIQMAWTIEYAHHVNRLDERAVTDRLQYVAEALRLTRTALAQETALLGFAGSPWTLANFMLEGGSAPEFTRARTLFHENPALYGRLAEKLAAATADYLKLQISAGVDAVQLFDTLGSEADPEDFDEVSGRWLRDIVAELRGAVPVIVFAKGVHDRWGRLAQTGARVLGVDWTVDLRGVADQLPSDVAVQGNLDPALLRGDADRVASACRALLESMRGRPGHILNLGHGVPPDARLDAIQALVESVRSFA
jgi:uroporphyrinogen decarboxylase